MAKRKLNCYIYTRVSTELQLDGYSLEAQKERLRKEASHRGMRIVGEYSDEGKSGKNVAGRPEFRKMLADIKSGKDNVDYVLVFKLSRFGRNTADTLNSLQYMEDYGVNLLCVEDNIDSAGASGKLMISVLAAVAEIERENIKEQTMAGRQQKARDGLWNGGFAPYGYKLVNVDGQKSKMLVVDEEEAKLIRLIYEKYLQGMGVNAVAKWLNENGYTKTVRQNGTVPNISAHFVTNVLDNPVYCGKISYGRRRTEKIDGTRNEFHVVKQDKESYKLYQGQHKAIIDEDTWYRVQVKRKKNAFKREKTHSLLHEHILSGIIKCPVCGSSMYGVVNRKKKKGSEEFYTDMWYYLCKNRKMVSGHLCDYKKHIRQDEINAEVIQLVKYVFCGENDMKDQILKKLGSDDSLSELLQEKERLTKEYEKLDSKKSKQLRRINELDIDDELYDDLMKTYRAGVQEINEQIAIIENQMYQNDLSIENAQGENLSAEVYKRIIDEMLDHIDDMPDSDKKLMMNLLIEKVEIYEEKQKDGRWVKSVQFKIPLNVDGKLVDTMFFDDEDTENSLSNEKHVDTVYGGGNQADAVNTEVQAINGKVNTVYGGGNAATVAKSVKVITGNETQNAADTKAEIKNLYCGNNEAPMELQPQIDLKSAVITNFYGGGNKGIMTSGQGLTYTFGADDLQIDTLYGGGNEAGVTESVTLNINDGKYTTIYGGSNAKGTVDKTNINIKGSVGEKNNLTGRIFGGGRGSETTVNTTNVNLQNGTIAGKVYGGSGFGKVGSATVTAKEAGADAKVQVFGDIFGAGYGVSSSVDSTNVNVDLKLNIVTTDNPNGDVKVTESLKSSEDKSGESKATATWLNQKSYTDGSYIAGSVFGGGDMGQVGKGYIYTSTNTATVEKAGTTNVTFISGYVHGNVFGGGNGQPGGTDESGQAIKEYTVYMGTVFGTSNVNVAGGYVKGNVFGCGQQSRTYAAEDSDGDKSADASMVKISSTSDPILIGGSIFGGGNKGNGSTQNASVATTYGDTHVTLSGPTGQYTPIYLLSDGNNGGGVYGDGNLCLVSGKKYVKLENFSCGVGEKASMLKTFYSLQRADKVDLTGSRIVLKGAVDLVAENADDTLYSINRVSQLNLKESSTIKVTKTVNLLGELTSDNQTDRQFIDRGNNTGNAFDSTGNNNADNKYTSNGGGEPSEPLKAEDIKNYISDYDKYISGKSVDKSINVVCVANGGYLEVKKNATQYGPVTGLFTLQLVNANPGEGGGFVYADIMGKQVKGSDNTDKKYVTGNFICVTKTKEETDDYMYVYHDVGGQVDTAGKYSYYVWYLKGNKYNYDVDLTAYIGTKDTDFTKSVSLAAEPNQSFVLTGLTQKEFNGIDLEKTYQNIWNDSDTDKASDKISVEVTMVKNQKNESSINTVETSIGYLGYQTEDDSNPTAAIKKTTDGKLVWGIWRKDAANNGWKFQACANVGENKSFLVSDGDALAQIDSDVVSAQLQFTLHKGTAMTTEFKNLPFEMKIAEVATDAYNTAVNGNRYIEDDACISLTTNLNLSAIRLVPTQAAYMGSGRMFAGVSSSSTVNITKKSAFTAQFVTKYIPSAFNTSSENRITETLETGYTDIYLLDDNGVGYTITDDNGTIALKNVTNTSDPNVKTYAVTKDSSGNYQVTYKDSSGKIMTDESGNGKVYTCKKETKESGFTIPKGTMITLLASLDEGNPSYWYYYCTENTSKVDLSAFKKMNTSNTDTSGKSESVYDTISTTSSSRVTENMIFVFNFEQVSDADWNSSQITQGQVMLKHTYNGGTYSSDIMDYVSSEKQKDDITRYTREMPKSTETFAIHPESDGITGFELTNGDSDTNYQQKDHMKFRLNITPDTSVSNTQYEERKYAVTLKLKKADDSSTDVAFPEGTVFTYNGKKLAAGKDNQYVIIPVGTAGSDHEVEIESNLYGFEAGDYKLEAQLYSTSVEGYYNSIPVTKKAADYSDVLCTDSAGFQIISNPKYALKVEETSKTEKTREKNHLVKAGDTFTFALTTKADRATSDNDTVQVQVYKYNGKSYDKINWESVLNGTQSIQTGENQKWKPTVSDSTSKGVYRLEFTYHDKIEYWDFMVE